MKKQRFETTTVEDGVLIEATGSDFIIYEADVLRMVAQTANQMGLEGVEVDGVTIRREHEIEDRFGVLLKVK